MDDEHLQVPFYSISMGRKAKMLVHRMHTFNTSTMSSESVRVDGVRYMREDLEKLGILDSVMHVRRFRCKHCALVRRLKTLESDVGTRKLSTRTGPIAIVTNSKVVRM